jgi:hypothetical protein
MRKQSVFLASACIAAALGLAAAGPARAQNDPRSLQVALTSLLVDAQKGVCGSQLSPLAAGSCQQQIGYLSNRLQSMGRVVNAQYKGMEKDGAVFQVQFERGSMTWMVAQDQAGRVTLFWTP